MKNKYILLGFLTLSLIGHSQNFSDDFEGYSPGDFIGSNSLDWTTWSGTTGGTEDAEVTNLNASNGANSVYFSSTSANGGPQDVVLPFGGVYNSGQFIYETSFFVESGKGAYFNFQGSNTIGQVYSMNCFMTQLGELTLDNGDGVLLSTTYTPNTWFELKLEIDLNTNDWEFFIDGVSKGIFSNTENKVASIDIFPVNNNYGGNNTSGFFIDEVSYNYTPYVLPNRNAAAIAILGTSALAGQDISPAVTVRNLGIQTITSFNVEVDYNGQQYTKNVSGISLSSFDTYDVDMAQLIPIIAGVNNLTATVSNVNVNGADDDAADDSKVLVLDPIVPAVGKVVVSEEGTGTWCGWCPRGAVAMDHMADTYDGFFSGIAVHNGDPMTVDIYDDGLGFTGFPGSVTDRGNVVDPSGIEAEFLQRITEMPSAFLTNGIYIDQNINKLYVSVESDFQTNISGDYRIACVLVEDSVTGTENGYNQSNYYAGGGSGVMGGYELLPSSVPASQMVYDHVARNIVPSFEGQMNSFPNTVNSGEVYYLPFEFDLDPTWDINHLHVVSLLIAPDGKIDNAGTATVEEGELNGYHYLEVADVEPISKSKIYPNPASLTAFVDVNVKKGEILKLSIIDLSGKTVVTNEFSSLNGNVQLPVNLERVSAGVYTVKIELGSRIENQKLIVK